MGRRGPKPVPTRILKLRGSRAADDRKGEPEPPEGMPDHRNLTGGKDTLAVWKQVTANLAHMGLLAKTDRLPLERYCRMVVRWRRAERFIEKHGESYPIMNTDKEGKQSVKCWAQYPQVGIANKLALMLTKMEAEFGFTPSSRSRIVVPEKQESEKSGKSRFFAS